MLSFTSRFDGLVRWIGRTIHYESQDANKIVTLSIDKLVGVVVVVVVAITFNR